MLSVAAPAFASDKPSAPPAPAPAAPDYSWQDKLERHTGVVTLLGSGAKLNLGEEYYFLDEAASHKVLVQGWGNPADAAGGVLGMIFPTRFKPMDDQAWGAVITYQDVGYVSDKDARKTDYDKLLNDLRKGEDDDNAERQKAGYSAVHLVGWAERPTYDAAHHVVIWARDLKFADTKADMLNYDIRVLGRKGVLSLNVVSSLSDLPEVRAAAGKIAGTAAFDSGSTYADYKKGDDKMAEYGVAGLIAAGVGVAAAKKLGLLALVFVALKKGAVLLVAGFASLVAWFRKTFGGGKSVGKDETPGGDNLIS